METKISGMVKGVKEADRSEEQRLAEEVKAETEACLEADARWVEKQREASEERSRAQAFREMAKRLRTEAMLLDVAAAAGEKRTGALSQQAEALSAEWTALERRRREATERWERLRYSLGLPFYDPEVGPPAWFTGQHEQPGLARSFVTEANAEMAAPSAP